MRGGSGSTLPDVGNIVEEFASDQATVVVGTVIDPNLGEDLKVTVVATGLGAPEKPNVIIDNTGAAGAGEEEVDYDTLDQPAYARNSEEPKREIVGSDDGAQDLDYLDIPAFLRRQAD